MSKDLLCLSGVTPEAIVHNVRVDYASLLGRGSFAADYAGTWHTPVAVKVLHPLLVQGGFDGQRKFLRQFGNECNRLRELRHKRVVQFLGVTRFRDSMPPMVTVRLDTMLQS